MPRLCLPSRCSGTLPHGHCRLRLVLAALGALIWGGGCEPVSLSRVACGQAALGTMPVRASVGISSKGITLGDVAFRGSSLPPLCKGLSPQSGVSARGAQMCPGAQRQVSWPFWSSSCPSGLGWFPFPSAAPWASLPLDKFCSSRAFLHQQCPAKLLADTTGDSPGVSSHSRILRDTRTPPRWLLPLQQHLSPPVFVELSP